MIFEGAYTSGFEEDARLTAMWLWTLSTGVTNGNNNIRTDFKPAFIEDNDEEVDEDVEKSKNTGKTKMSGYMLEYDAATGCIRP
ncbi:MAG: hypothetical protein E3K36_09755 [Candidatus Brocadia sp.]|nr:hypothetical protein [Candidatus Brocadia sp.]